MSFFTHAFEAVITRHPIGNGPRVVTYKVVYLPTELEAELPFDQHPRLRITGEIADVPVEGAWQPSGQAHGGGYYLMVPKAVFSGSGVKVGECVDIRFSVADQDAVDMPDALSRALDEDDDVRMKWDRLASGAKRAFAYRVSSAKRDATIAKRVDEVMHMVREGLRYGKGGSIR